MSQSMFDIYYIAFKINYGIMIYKFLNEPKRILNDIFNVCTYIHLHMYSNMAS